MKRRHHHHHYNGVRDNTSGALPTPDDEYCEECGEEMECCSCEPDPEPEPKPTCRTCKHWQIETNEPADALDVGLCLKSGCYDDDTANIVFAEDNEKVYSRPDFGCIHHEPPPEAKPE